jgi:hypothetical protein
MDVNVDIITSDKRRCKLYQIYSTLDARHYRSSIPKGRASASLQSYLLPIGVYHFTHVLTHTEREFSMPVE